MSLDENSSTSDTLKNLEQNCMIYETVVDSSQDEMLGYLKNHDETVSLFSDEAMDQNEELLREKLNIGNCDAGESSRDEDKSGYSIRDDTINALLDGSVFSNERPNESSDDIDASLDTSMNSLIKNDGSTFHDHTLFEKYETKMYDSSSDDLFADNKNDNYSSSDEDINLDLSSHTSDSDSDDENHTVRYYSSFMHSFYDDTKSDSILNTETSLIEKEEIKPSDDYIEKLDEEPMKIDVYTKDTIKHIQDYLTTDYEFARIKHMQKQRPLFESYNPKDTTYLYCTINELLCLEKPPGFSPRIYLIGVYSKNENAEHILYDRKFKTSITLIFHRRESTPILGTNILLYGTLHFNKNYIGVKVHCWTLLSISSIEKTHKRFYEQREKIRNEQKCPTCKNLIT